MKVLAKLGLVTAAAATVLFIFIYEFQGPVINSVMSEPPNETNTLAVVEAQTEESVESTTPGSETPAVDQEVPNELPMEDAKVEDEPEENTTETIASEGVETEPSEVEPAIGETPVEAANPAASVQTRRIYGKIVLATTGELLEGVNIMIPGSKVAKISNANGGYTIEIPKTSRELVFIYRGKKLVQRIGSENNLLNVKLDLETMKYD